MMTLEFVQQVRAQDIATPFGKPHCALRRIRPGIGAKAARGVTHAMRGDLTKQKKDGRIIDVVEVARAPTLRNLRHARKQIVAPARAFHRLLPVAITAPAPPSAHYRPRVRAPRHRRALAWRRSRRAISYKTRDRWSASATRPAPPPRPRSSRAAHRDRAARCRRACASSRWASMPAQTARYS